MRRIVVLCALLAVAAGSAEAQVVASIDPGMTKSEVIERLGKPAAERSSGAFTYLFYGNGCERECGMSDLVTLERDAVVDAIFRSGARRYTGTSSSPEMRTPATARAGTRAPAPLAVRAPAAAAAPTVVPDAPAPAVSPVVATIPVATPALVEPEPTTPVVDSVQPLARPDSIRRTEAAGSRWTRWLRPKDGSRKQDAESAAPPASAPEAAAPVVPADSAAAGPEKKRRITLFPSPRTNAPADTGRTSPP